MSSLEIDEVVDTVEDKQQLLLAVLFPLALLMMFISQSSLPIIPVTATILLLVLVAAFYATLFIENIEI